LAKPYGANHTLSELKVAKNDYTIGFWPHHYKRIENSTLKVDADRLLSDFVFSSSGVCFVQWLVESQQLLNQDTSEFPETIKEELKAAQNNGYSSLFSACVYNFRHILRSLHDQAAGTGIEIDWAVENTDGESALSIGVAFGDADTLELILSNEASVSAYQLDDILSKLAWEGKDWALDILLAHATLGDRVTRCKLGPDRLNGPQTDIWQRTIHDTMLLKQPYTEIIPKLQRCYYKRSTT
jgi:hypothetical protein